MKDDYYAILGVPFNATIEQINIAWKLQLRQYHPDICPIDTSSEENRKKQLDILTKKCQLINNAHDILKNQQARKVYDSDYLIKIESNPLYYWFPYDSKITTIRPNQKIALNEIWQAIERGDKKITLCGPVGSGKSKIAETILRYFQSQSKKGVYTSPLNSLVDQIEDTKHTESRITTLKGKRYYDCIAKGDGTKCDEGYCARKICYMTRDAPKERRMKRECKGCRVSGCKCNQCVYKSVFRAYRHSEIGNTNSSLWLMGIIPDETKILIIDEADYLEEFVRIGLKVAVPYRLKKKDDPKKDEDLFSNHIDAAGKYADNLESCLSCEKDYDCIPRNLHRFKSKIESIRNMTNDYEEHKEDWVIRKEIKGDKVRTTYEPITVNRFVEPLIEDLDFTLSMSATPPKWQNFKFIEVPSPFPIDIRQCYYHPLGNYSKKHREANMPKLAEFLSTLRGKTVVHCGSYSFANMLATALQKYENIWPLLQVRENGIMPKELEYLDYESTSRYDAVSAFVKSEDPNKIYLSVNMGRGIDLWQPEIQNNVIAVVPWSDPTDLLTIAKTKLLGESWKNENTAILIEQEHGRIHRGIFYLKDVVKSRPDLSWLPVNSQGMVCKRTYITDSNFNSGKGMLTAWYQRNKRFFSQSFNEVMKL